MPLGDPLYHNTLSDEEDEKLELRSLRSEEMNTFITEPTFNRIKVGKQVLERQASNSKLRKQLEKTKNYEKGDFISRNMAVFFNSYSLDQMPDFIMH